MAYPIPLPACGYQTIHPANFMSPSPAIKSLFWDMCAADVCLHVWFRWKVCLRVFVVEMNECAYF